ncbi:MAG: DNA repair protein RadA [bacterium]
MVKKKSSYICSNCSYTTLKWLGRCPECGEWNTLEEKDETVIPKENHRLFLSSPEAVLSHIREVVSSDSERISSGYSELDRILGGGIVRGSYNLISGHPGVGKSTLMLQAALALSKSCKVLYLSAEESVSQVKIRFERLAGKEKSKELYLSNENNLDRLRGKLEEEDFDFLFCDSIQSVYSPSVQGIPGSVSQIKECAVKLLETAKRKNITVFVIGHVTKSGAIAGPMLLEHMVDAVLLFEGDSSLGYRVLRCSKNRFGPTDEIGIFEMTSAGLSEVKNPSQFFLTGEKNAISGSALALILEGSRPFLIEVQSLAASSNLPQPRRVATGIDAGRLAMITAVLEKRCDIYYSNFDLFVNIVGGLKLKTPACDLPVAASLLSSVFNIALPMNTAFVGELGLGGEVRDVPGLEIMLKEGSRLGLRKIYAPAGKTKIKKSEKTEIVRVKSVFDIIEHIRSMNIFD